MPRWASYKNSVVSALPSSCMSTSSVQYDDGAEAFAKAFPLPTDVFLDWFLAVADGVGEFAFAFSAEPVLTVGAPCWAACDCAAEFIAKLNESTKAATRFAFFIGLLLSSEFPLRYLC